MMKLLQRFAHTLLVAALVGGCNSTTVRSTEQAPLAESQGSIPESQLMDVGIGIFDPGVDALTDPDKEQVYPAIRRAEARFIPENLARTLQESGNWGVVRVIPDQRSEMDLWVDGTILQSDGLTLKLQITVKDASGRQWYTRSYEEEASKYAYDKELSRSIEPFQGLYNRIANDLAAWRSQVSPEEVARIRTVNELKFAQRFAPDAFSGYLAVDSKGRYQVTRLPAAGDPLMERIRRIRERDNLFVDTLQDYYGNFSSQMKDPYLQWRQESYTEIQALRESEKESIGGMVGGGLLMAAGIAAMILGGNSSSTAGQVLGGAGGAVATMAGATIAKEGYDKRSDVKMHAEALKEIAASLDADITPHKVELEDRTVTLTGTADQQYAQWRALLQEIYRTETGTIVEDPVPAN